MKLNAVAAALVVIMCAIACAFTRIETRPATPLCQAYSLDGLTIDMTVQEVVNILHTTPASTATEIRNGNTVAFLVDGRVAQISGMQLRRGDELVVKFGDPESQLGHLKDAADLKTDSVYHCGGTLFKTITTWSSCGARIQVEVSGGMVCKLDMKRLDTEWMPPRAR